MFPPYDLRPRVAQSLEKAAISARHGLEPTQSPASAASKPRLGPCHERQDPELETSGSSDSSNLWEDKRALQHIPGIFAGSRRPQPTPATPADGCDPDRPWRFDCRQESSEPVSG